jgi:hypothetical protein
MSDGEQNDVHSALEREESVGTSSSDSIDAITPAFASVSGNGAGNGDSAMLEAMARQVEEKPVVGKRSLKEKIVHEVIEIGGVILYLFVSFAVLQTFRCGTLLFECSENDFISGYTTALISALALGKFVFVLDKMKFVQKFKEKPLIIPILYKTALFTCLMNVILNIEERILHRQPEHHEFHNTSEFMLCYFAHQLAFFLVFFFFFCYRGISGIIGEKRMFKLFFVSRDDFISKEH